LTDLNVIARVFRVYNLAFILTIRYDTMDCINVRPKADE